MELLAGLFSCPRAMGYDTYALPMAAIQDRRSHRSDSGQRVERHQNPSDSDQPVEIHQLSSDSESQESQRPRYVETRLNLAV